MSDRLLRARGGGHEAGRVTYVELFFDLVFVFAITQLSHTLLHDSSPKGWLETGILLLGVCSGSTPPGSPTGSTTSDAPSAWRCWP